MQDRLKRCSTWFWEKCCFLTAIIHVIAMFIEIGSHILLILFVTNGLQCNTNLDALHKNWITLEKIIHFSTLGVHGFTPFLAPYGEVHEDTLNEKICCYGIIHLPFLDILIIVINLIWYKFVLSFYYSLYRKDIQRIQLFLNLATIKLLMEIFYKGIRYNISEYMLDVSWKSELMNFFLYYILMTSVYYHMKFLQNQTSKPAITIIELQCEVNDKIEDKTNPIAKEKEEKPSAYALV